MVTAWLSGPAGLYLTAVLFTGAVRLWIGVPRTRRKWLFTPLIPAGIAVLYGLFTGRWQWLSLLADLTALLLTGGFLMVLYPFCRFWTRTPFRRNLSGVALGTAGAFGAVLLLIYSGWLFIGAVLSVCGVLWVYRRIPDRFVSRRRRNSSSDSGHYSHTGDSGGYDSSGYDSSDGGGGGSSGGGGASDSW